jgi:hypothetical protein
MMVVVFVVAGDVSWGVVVGTSDMLTWMPLLEPVETMPLNELDERNSSADNTVVFNDGLE